MQMRTEPLNQIIAQPPPPLRMALCPLIIFILHFCILGCIFYASSCSACLHACFMLILRFLTKEARVLFSSLAFFTRLTIFRTKLKERLPVLQSPLFCAIVSEERIHVTFENSYAYFGCSLRQVLNFNWFKQLCRVMQTCDETSSVRKQML